MATKQHSKALRRKILAKNKRAYFDYTIVHEYTAGIVLKGSEVKSVRAGQLSLQEAYCFFAKHELWLKNMHIAPLGQDASSQEDPLRVRKLLLQKCELRKLHRLKKDAMTIVPLYCFFNDKACMKICIALVRGKKLYDKRHTIKLRDLERSMKRETSHT